MTVYPPCRKCGAAHGMGIENMETGHIEPMDICYDCLWMGQYKLLATQITLDNLPDNLICEWGGSMNAIIDGEVKNVADHLNERERRNDNANF